MRVTRALTPTPSSSSSDDEEPRARKKFKTRRNAARVSDAEAPRHPHVDVDDGTELVQVADSICQLPGELFKLPDLGEVLSLHTWNDCLTEEERQSLCSYLPDMDQESYNKTLKELFRGKNFHFGRPLVDLWQCLKDGMCDPNVVSSRQALMTLERKEHYHRLRQYHNGMVNSLLEMRDLWLNDPEANLEERLNSWHAWKSKVSYTGAHHAALDTVMPAKPHPTGNLKVKTSSKPRDGGEQSRISSGVQSSDSAQPLHGNAADQRHLNMYPSSEFAREEEQSHIDACPVISPLNYEIQGSEMLLVVKKKTQSNTGSGTKHKRGNETRETVHGSGMSVEEMGKSRAKSSPNVKLQKAQKKTEHAKQEDRHAKGYSTETNTRVIDVYEDGQLISVSNTEQDANRDMGCKDSEVVARETPSDAHLKKCKSRAHEVEPSSSPLRESLSADDPAKLMRKGGLPLVPPSASSFPFSILHFLSAVRAALLDPLEPESSETEYASPITFKEIVRRVQAHPGDHQIMVMQLPFEGLVRGVLKVLSCNIRKPALKGLKPFVVYDKAVRCWCWIGPLPDCPLSFDETDVQALAKVWCVSPTILYEIQDAFAKWLKTAEKTLQQLGQLALVPLPTFPVLPNEKERFKDLRAQKSLTTITPSSHEMKALFQREEVIRYSTSEMAFCYTTADGQKSAVAPLRRVGGKSKAKARDHFMLKPDRPSHITILCLVRDAAARLPQRIGTRADVCTLLRDSQFIVEDVPELQLSQVVSGALDRLHYERDPCVRYDSDKKLWVYLHADRDDEDFEEGGTTSTRSSKRTKKEGADIGDSPAQGQGYNEDMSEAELDSGSVNCSGGMGDSASPELLYDHQNGGPTMMVPGAAGGQAREEVLLPFIDLPPSMQPFCGNMQSHPMGWEVYKAGKELSIIQ